MSRTFWVVLTLANMKSNGERVVPPLKTNWCPFSHTQPRIVLDGLFQGGLERVLLGLSGTGWACQRSSKP